MGRGFGRWELWLLLIMEREWVGWVVGKGRFGELMPSSGGHWKFGGRMVGLCHA